MNAPAAGRDARAGNPLWALASCSGLFSFALAFAWTARDALFLTSLNADWLPPVFVASALVNALASVAVVRLLARMNNDRLFLLLYGACVLALLAGRGAVGGGARWACLLLYLLVQLVGLLLSVVFWSFTATVYDPRTAKKYYAPLAGAGLVMGMVGGFLAKPINHAVGTPNVLFFAAVPVALGAVIQQRTALRLGRAGTRQVAVPAAPAPGRSGRPSRPRLLSELGADAHFFNLFSVTVVATLVANIVHYLYSAAASARFSDPAQLAGFFGTVSGVCAVFALLLQLLGTGRLVRRLGTPRANLIAPLVMLASGIAFVARGTFAPAVAWKAVDFAANYGFGVTAFGLLYIPFADATRARHRTSVEGIGKPIGLAAAGLIIFATRQALPQRAVGLFGVALVVVWLLLALRLRRSYVGALAASLRDADLRLAASGLRAIAESQDRSTIAVVKEAIASPRSDVALLAMDVVRRAGWKELLADVVARLSDHETAVVLGALEVIRALGGKGEIPAVRSLLDTEDPARIPAAIAALGALEGTEGPGLHLLVDRLRALLATQPPLEIARALRAIGAAAFAPLAPQARALVGASDLAVAQAAITAVGQLADPEAVPALRAVLSAGGPLRVQAIEALARIAAGAPAAARALATTTLLTVLDSSDRSLQLAAALALGRHLGHDVAAVFELRPRLLYTIEKAGDELLRLRLLELDLGGILAGAHGVVLRHHLTARIAAQTRSVAAVLGLLALPVDPGTLTGRLGSADERQRATALEAIETVLPRELGLRLVAVLDLPNPDRLRALVPTVVGSNHVASQGAGQVAPAVRLAELARAGRTTAPDAQTPSDGEGADRWLALAAHHCAVRAGFTSPAPLWSFAQKKESAVLELMDRVMFLKGVPLFAGLATEDLFALAELAQVIDQPEQRTIFRQGEVGDALYVIIAGGVDVAREGGDGRSTLLSRFGAGEHFGEMAILSEEPRSATVRTNRPSSLLSVSKSSFLAALAGNPTMNRPIMDALIQRLRGEQPRLG